MKSTIVFAFIALFTAVISGAQDVVENPAIPAGQKAEARVMPLQEVLRISDEGGDFLFESIRRIKIAPDGSVFVQEREKLLKFSPEGKFQTNLVVMGEGPGEVKRLANFAIDGDEVVVGGYTPVKLLFMDMAGNVNEEKRIEGLKDFTLFSNAVNGRYYFRDLNLSFESVSKQNSGVVPQTHTLLTSNRAGEVTPLGLEFKTRNAMVKRTSDGGVAIGISEITRFMSAFDEDRYLYVSHTGRYGVSQVDLKTGKIVRRFSRAYEPVPFVPAPPEENQNEFDNEIEKIKRQKFFNDILALQVNDHRIMVVTSTLDRENRVLVDVFDESGKYIDRFFLKIPDIEHRDDLANKPLCFYGDFFWSVELDEDDVPTVVKYRMGEE